MPMNRKLYPDNWKKIAKRVKDDADWRCEECGKPCLMPGQTWPELVSYIEHHVPSWYEDTYEKVYNSERGEWENVEKKGRFILTVAHLDHRPQNCDRSNLRALCAPCHCRYDLSQMNRKKYLKRERLGQINLLD